MKIGIIVPNIQMTGRQLEERKDFLMKKAQPGTEIEMIKLEQGPLSIESSFEHEQAGYYMAKRIRELNREGYHAFITWCGEDAGLTSAREVTRVPVIGPFQSSCSAAILLGHKLSIIAPMVQKAFMERKVWELGLGPRLASIRSLEIPVLQVRKNLTKTFLLLEKECERAVRKDGADVIIFSCMALFGAAKSLMEKLKIPIVDPALAALKMAETFVSLGLTHSKISYPFPPK
jgi:allantoin racemase